MALLLEFNEATMAMPIAESQCHIVRSRVEVTEKISLSDHYSFKFVVKGVERYTLHQQTVQLKAGDYLLVKPGTAYTASVPGAGVTEGLCIYFPEALTLEMFSTLVQSTVKLLDSAYEPCNTAIPWLEMKRNLATSGVSDAVYSIQSLANQLIGEGGAHMDDCYPLLLLEQLLVDNTRIRLQMAKLPQIKVAVKQEIIRRLSLSHELMINEYSRPVTLQELATTASLSVFHFSRLFKQVYGCSPCAYLLQIRLGQAANQLRNSLLPVGEIALRCGFADHASFCRAFRQFAGIAPLHYRNSKN